MWNCIIVSYNFEKMKNQAKILQPTYRLISVGWLFSAINSFDNQKHNYRASANIIAEAFL